MDYWVFNEQQLDEALDAWTRSQSFGEAIGTGGVNAVREFLKSDAAREHKLLVEEKK